MQSQDMESNVDGSKLCRIERLETRVHPMNGSPMRKCLVHVMFKRSTNKIHISGIQLRVLVATRLKTHPNKSFPNN